MLINHLLAEFYKILPLETLPDFPDLVTGGRRANTADSPDEELVRRKQLMQQKPRNGRLVLVRISGKNAVMKMGGHGDKYREEEDKEVDWWR